MVVTVSQWNQLPKGNREFPVAGCVQSGAGQSLVRNTLNWIHTVSKRIVWLNIITASFLFNNFSDHHDHFPPNKNPRFFLISVYG